MNLQLLTNCFSICKVDSINKINFDDEFLFIGKTDEEISLVCTETSTPKNYIDCEKGWKCIKICGSLDFSLVGIIARISSLLAEKNISVFVVSTYNTDYILVKEKSINDAVKVLKENNYNFI